MNMDATIDGLVDTCERNWVEKQALGPVGSKLTASALLALAGGAAGAGVGYLFDRGRVDPDESPSARARKMKQRMLRGAGIGAAVGGATGLVLGTDKRPELEPHERAAVIKAKLGPAFSGGAAQEATVRELSGQPVEKGFVRQMGRTLWDARPEFLGGTPVNDAVEVAGTAIPAAYAYAHRDDILRNTGIRNYWRGIGGRGYGANPIADTVGEAGRMSGMPGSANYARVIGEQYGGINTEAARVKILQAILARQGNPGNAPGIVPVPRGTADQLTAQLPAGVARMLRKGRLGPYSDIVEHQMKTGPGADATIPGGAQSVVGDPRKFHAGQVGWGKGDKGLKATWKPGGTAANLALGRRMTVSAIVGHLIARAASNAGTNIRMRRAASDIANGLVTR